MDSRYAHALRFYRSLRSSIPPILSFSIFHVEVSFFCCKSVSGHTGFCL